MSTTPYFRTLAGIGNLGVGTTSPTSNLQVVGNVYVSNALSTTNVIATTMNTGTMNVTSIAVAGSTATTGYVLSSASSGAGLSWVAQPAGLSGLGTNGILYATSSTTAATVPTYVYSGGNVGIGTAGPTSNLHVYGSSTSNIQMIINNVANAGGSNYSAFVHSDQAFCGGVSGVGTYTYSGATLLVTSYPNNTANNSGYTVYFGTSASDTTSLVPQLVVSSATGYVGIATATPKSNLHVVGNIYASNALTTTNIFAAGFSSNATNTTFNFDTIVVPYLNVTSVSVTGSINVQQTANIYIANIANIYTTNIVGFVASQWTTGTGNIYYLSNVGIGTSTVSANLSVAGNIYASNALTTQNVFVTGNVNVQGLSNLYVANIATANVSTLNVSSISVSGSTPTSGYVLSTTGTGLAWIAGGGGGSSQWTTGTGNIYYISNVGIGTSTVSANLSVAGNIYASNALTTQNVFVTGNVNVQGLSNLYVANIATANVSTLNVSSISVSGSTPTSGYVLSTTGTGLAWIAGGGGGSSQWTTGTGNIYYISNVGIGTSTVSANLSVVGNIYASNALQTTNISAAGFTSNSTNTIFNYDTVTIPFIYSTTTNVSTLNVSSISVSGSTPTSGYVLSTTGTGLAWIAAGSGGSSQWTGTSGSPIYYLSNVGIGTTGGPSNLAVVGTSYFSSNVGIGTTSTVSLFEMYGVGPRFSIMNSTGASNHQGIDFYTYTNEPVAGCQIDALDDGTYSAHMYFNTKQPGGPTNSLVNRFTILSSGLIGIATTVPTSNLHVVGNIYASNALTTQNVFVTGNVNVQGLSNLYVANIATANVSTLNVTSISVSGSTPTSGYVLSTTGTGLAWIAGGGGGSQWTTGTGNIYYISNVGIGTSLVSSNLSVVGNVTVSNALTTTNVFVTTANTTTLNVSSISVAGSTPTAGYILSSTGSGLAWIAAGGAGSTQWAGTAGSPIYYIQNVGIGTNNPTANLSVAGNLYVSNSITTTNLISPGFSSNTTNAIFSQDTATIPILSAYNLNVAFSANVSTLVTPGLFSGVNPNVGIGITTPSATLHVVGNAYVSNALQTASIYYSDDTTRRSPHIVPTVSNATQIQSWISFQSNIVSQQSSFWAPASRPIFSTMATGPPLSNAYIGSVAMADGRTVFIPYGASTFGVFNSATNQYSAVVPSGASLTPTSGWGNGLYFGGVQAPSGNIVCIPHVSGNIGLYDPEGMSFSNALAHNCPSGAFAGGVLDGNSNITMIPYNSLNVCSYNGSTGLFSNMVKISTTAPKLVGGVLLPNGNIIGIPFGTSNVIQYSPTALTFSNIVIAPGFFGGVLTPNGNVVCVPYTNGNVVVLNPTSGSFSNITAAGANGFAGGTLLPNGQVALTPFTNSNVGLFNPTTLTLSNIVPQGTSTSNAYFGASLTSDGRVVFCPNQSQYIGILNTMTPVPSAEYRLVPYINKL